MRLKIAFVLTLSLGELADELRRWKEKLKSIETMDTLDVTMSRKYSPWLEDSMLYGTRDTKYQSDFMTTDFKTPVARKQDSVNSKLSSTLRTHRIENPAFQNRLSSPKCYKSFSDLKPIQPSTCLTNLKRPHNSDLKIKRKFHQKMCSTSPNKMLRMPIFDSSEKSDYKEEEEGHYKPYVLVNNQRDR
jgi:hypothetical protein